MNIIKTEYFNNAPSTHQESLMAQMLYAALKSADMTAILLNHKDSIRNIMLDNHIFPTASNTKASGAAQVAPRPPHYQLTESERPLVGNYVKKMANYPVWVNTLLGYHAWMTEALFEEVLEIALSIGFIADAIQLNEDGWGDTLVSSSIQKLCKSRDLIGDVIQNLDDEELDASDSLTCVMAWQSELAHSLENELSLKLGMRLTNVMQQIFFDLDSTAYNEGTKALHLIQDGQEVAVVDVPTALFRPLPFSRSTFASGIHHIFEIMDGHGLSQDNLKSAFENTLSNPINKSTYRLEWLENGYVRVHHLNQF